MAHRDTSKGAHTVNKTIDLAIDLVHAAICIAAGIASIAVMGCAVCGLMYALAHQAAGY